MSEIENHSENRSLAVSALSSLQNNNDSANIPSKQQTFSSPNSINVTTNGRISKSSILDRHEASTVPKVPSNPSLNSLLHSSNTSSSSTLPTPPSNVTDSFSSLLHQTNNNVTKTTTTTTTSTKTNNNTTSNLPNGTSSSSNLKTHAHSSKRSNIKDSSSSITTSASSQPTNNKSISSTDSKFSDDNITIYAEDEGVIRCICGFSDDDGFTIQCERCNVWQHAVCVNIHDSSEVPEIYLCDRCGKLSYDTEAAHQIQLKRIQASKLQSENLAKGSKRKRSTEGDDREVKHFNYQSPKDYNSQEAFPNQSPTTTSHTSSNSHSRNNSNNGNGSSNGNSNSTSTTTTRKGRSKRLTLEPPDEHEPDNEPEKKFTMSEMYHSYFVSIRQNRYSTPKIRKQILELAKLDPSQLDESTSYLTQSEFNSIELPTLSVKLTSDHPKQKFSGFSRFGLFIDSAVSRDRFITEYVGLVVSKEEYKRNPINQYRHFGVPKPGVMFHPSLPFAIDARQVGSISRFIRRSCRPNCKVSTVIVNDSNVIFVVFASEPLKPGSELTVAWEWDQNHPARKLIDDVPYDKLTKEERMFLVSSANFIHQRGSECACNLAQSECILGRMKKAMGNPSRVTRTVSKSRRTGLLDGKNSLLEDYEINGSRSSSSQDLNASTSFYSNREAKKLQSAMALFKKISSNTSVKKRKQDDLEQDSDTTNQFDPANDAKTNDQNKTNDDNINGTDKDVSMSDDLETNKEPVKKVLDHAVQTDPLVVPLHSSLSSSTQLITTNDVKNVQNYASRLTYKQRIFRRYIEKAQVASSETEKSVKLIKDSSTPQSAETKKTSIASKILGRDVSSVVLVPPQEPKRRIVYRTSSISSSGGLSLKRSGSTPIPFGRTSSSTRLALSSSSTSLSSLLKRSSASPPVTPTVASPAGNGSASSSATPPAPEDSSAAPTNSISKSDSSTVPSSKLLNQNSQNTSKNSTPVPASATGFSSSSVSNTATTTTTQLPTKQKSLYDDSTKGESKISKVNESSILSQSSSPSAPSLSASTPQPTTTPQVKEKSSVKVNGKVSHTSHKSNPSSNSTVSRPSKTPSSTQQSSSSIKSSSQSSTKHSESKSNNKSLLNGRSNSHSEAAHKSSSKELTNGSSNKTPSNNQKASNSNSSVKKSSSDHLNGSRSKESLANSNSSTTKSNTTKDININNIASKSSNSSSSNKHAATPLTKSVSLPVSSSSTTTNKPDRPHRSDSSLSSSSSQSMIKNSSSTVASTSVGPVSDNKVDNKVKKEQVPTPSSASSTSTPPSSTTNNRPVAQIPGKKKLSFADYMKKTKKLQENTSKSQK